MSKLKKSENLGSLVGTTGARSKRFSSFSLPTYLRLCKKRRSVLFGEKERGGKNTPTAALYKSLNLSEFDESCSSSEKIRTETLEREPGR